MDNELRQFEQRKQEHIELSLLSANQATECNSFDQYSLMHEAIPDLDFDEISIQTERFGQRVAKPFIVSSMTAGHKDAGSINHHLMAACAVSGWAMGVGSQRRELFAAHLPNEWQSLRKLFPEVCLFSNIGLAQIITGCVDDIKRLTANLQAQALIVHCNPLQELIQPEGTPHFKGAWQALEALVKALELPVVVKETGCGFSQKTLKRLNEIGVLAVDVSGLGGTHWGRIEGGRAGANQMHVNAASTFRNWGIETPVAVQNAISLSPQFEVWGSGGVRHGLDAAKLFALGATTIGFAKAMLVPALESEAAVLSVMNTIEYELKIAMMCTGSRTLAHLKEALCP